MFFESSLSSALCLCHPAQNTRETEVVFFVVFRRLSHNDEKYLPNNSNGTEVKSARRVM